MYALFSRSRLLRVSFRFLEEPRRSQGGGYAYKAMATYNLFYHKAERRITRENQPYLITPSPIDPRLRLRVTY